MTPQELREWLVTVFPSFQKEWDEEEDCHSLHQVFMLFAPYFGSNAQAFTEIQLTALGDLINRAVRNDDDLENAISTCFLEHLHQVNPDKVMSPHLSNQAKRKMHV